MPASTTRIRFEPVGRPDFSINVPGSKSASNRALPIAALSSGTSRLTGVLRADDTEVMMLALQSLGFPLEADGTTVTVTGQGGSFPVDRADLDMQLSGTSLRFLVPILAAGRGEYRFHGTQRMHQRPVGDLLDALVRLGVDVRSEADTVCRPVLLSARGLKGGATVVQGERSSQFLSGLLLAAPLASGGLDIMVEGDLQSRPFVDLTLSMMQDFGVTVQRTGYERFLVQPQQYRARDLAIEGDATAA